MCFELVSSSRGAGHIPTARLLHKPPTTRDVQVLLSSKPRAGHGPGVAPTEEQVVLLDRFDAGNQDRNAREGTRTNQRWQEAMTISTGTTWHRPSTTQTMLRDQLEASCLSLDIVASPFAQAYRPRYQTVCSWSLRPTESLLPTKGLPQFMFQMYRSSRYRVHS